MCVGVDIWSEGGKPSMTRMYIYTYVCVCTHTLRLLDSFSRPSSSVLQEQVRGVSSLVASFRHPWRGRSGTGLDQSHLELFGRNDLSSGEVETEVFRKTTVTVTVCEERERQPSQPTSRDEVREWVSFRVDTGRSVLLPTIQWNEWVPVSLFSVVPGRSGETCSLDKHPRL